MLKIIATAIKRGARAALCAVHRRLLAWTRHATGTGAGSAIGDLTRTKAALQRRAERLDSIRSPSARRRASQVPSGIQRRGF